MHCAWPPASMRVPMPSHRRSSRICCYATATRCRSTCRRSSTRERPEPEGDAMSYDRLMDHAFEIEEKATKRAIVKHSEGLGDQGPIAYSSITDYRSYPEYRLFADVPDLFRPFAALPDPNSLDP